MGNQANQQAAQEQRDVQVAQLAQKLSADWSAKLLAGDKRAISDLHNVVLDRLTEDDAKVLFIQAATDQAGADVRFAKLAGDAMFAVCLADAERAVQFIEQTCREAAAEDRFDRVMLERLERA